MIRALITLSFCLALVSCSLTKSGPTLERGSGADKQGEEIETLIPSEIDYRAEGPFSEGPDAPPPVEE